MLLQKAALVLLEEMISPELVIWGRKNNTGSIYNIITYPV